MPTFRPIFKQHAKTLCNFQSSSLSSKGSLKTLLPLSKHPFILFFFFLLSPILNSSMAIHETEYNNKKKNEATEPLIPGLPDEIAELCLLHLPYPYQALVRSVSSSWNRAITNPSFLVSKRTLSSSLARPYLFVFAFHKPTSKFQWQALDPSSSRWFVLPAMPTSTDTFFPPTAITSLPKQGKLFVMADTMHTTTLVYRTTTNNWSPAAIPESPPFFAAEGTNETIVTVSGSGGTLGAEIYDPESDTWRQGAKLDADEVAAYEAAESGGKVYVTEGWRWPFTSRPRGWVYEVVGDTWHEMGEGMREGWFGVAISAAGRVFVIPEYGECEVKVYDERSDTWRRVGGDRFPREKMKRPFAAKGLDGRIYVAGRGLNVAIGSVVVLKEEGKERQGQGEECCGVEVRWEVVEAPEAFHELQPCNCQVLYA